jgi:hypothetical protein
MRSNVLRLLTCVGREGGQMSSANSPDFSAISAIKEVPLRGTKATEKHFRAAVARRTA